MLLDDGYTVRFGDNQADIEKLWSCQATSYPLPFALVSSDKLVQGKMVTLTFDSGLLKKIKFLEDYQFVNPPTPFPESWKNFPVIGRQKICRRMSRADFLMYLAVWEERATQLGATKVEFGDLTSQQFAVSLHQEENWDHISIDMGPSRRAGGGGIWCDGWGASFTTDGEGRETLGVPAGFVKDLSAFRDEFNTVARKH